VFGRKLVVTHHRPVRRPLLLLTAFALTVIVAFFAYVYGTATLSIRYGAVRTERDVLAEQSRVVEAENAELRERVAVLERASQIDRRAYEDVDKHLLALQMETFALKEEVAFYQGIVSSSMQTGFHIQSFDVKHDTEQDGYWYQLVLTHDLKNDKVISGMVTVSVSGEQHGRSRELHAQDLWPGSDHGIVFRFKHFQRVEGRFVLPDGFSPHSVTIHVIGTDEQELTAERTFSWPQPA